jgi:hypothetical protein
MDSQFLKSVQAYEHFIGWITRFRPHETYKPDYNDFFPVWYPGPVELTIIKNDIPITYSAEWNVGTGKLSDTTPNELLNLYEVRREARETLKNTVFNSIKEWAVVCLSQWSDIPFEAFAANCSDFCPYYKLGGGGQNLHAAMLAAKTAREAQEGQ